MKFGTLLAGGMLAALVVQGFDERFDGPAIRYRTADSLRNPVAQLGTRLASGEKLAVGSDGTVLKSFLQELTIPEASQVLVFSKTSLQTDYISPQSPRAIYFNDDIYVGSVKGSSILEISVQDPELGAVFYTLDHRRGKGALQRETDACLRCHAPRHTEMAPAHVVRSVFPDEQGFAMLRNGSFFTNDNSPFENRWGGWYVTGKYPEMTHMGNRIGHEDKVNGTVHFQSDDSGQRSSLKEFFDPDRYLRPTSDVVALMVMEHQIQIHNAITLAGYQARLAVSDERLMDKALNRETAELSPLTRRRIEHYGDQLVRALIFADAKPLPAPVSGDPDFVRSFQAGAVARDSKGRSLRDLDLESSLFRYPCSFLIQSDGFRSLPDQLKEYVYRKLYDGLTGEDMSDLFMHLDAASSKDVLTILRETEPNLPDYWRAP